MGRCPPAAAFIAVSVHAQASEKELRRLAKERDCTPSKLGLAFGSLFSISRHRVADATLTAERSYRATLLGMHHGVDLVSLFACAAREEEDDELADWCEKWLTTRSLLVDEATAQLE
ncbi:MAG TPA: hypothetical protein VF407_24955, partial [Polyangiaceae bacterium]